MQKHDIKHHISIVYFFVSILIDIFVIGTIIFNSLFSVINFDVKYCIMIICFILIIVLMFPIIIMDDQFITCVLTCISSFLLSMYSCEYIYAAYITYPLLLIQALIITILLFVLFTVLAKYISNDSLLLLGILLLGSLSGIICIGIMNIVMMYISPEFAQTYNLIDSICLVVGIITFCGYVAYDTALMYERFRDGEYKYCYHAFRLFLDIINLFADILRILIKFKKD